MEKIRLVWAQKFRELVKESKYPIREFLKYCDQKEAELNQAWTDKERAEKYEKFKAKRNLDKLADGLRSFKLW